MNTTKDIHRIRDSIKVADLCPIIQLEMAAFNTDDVHYNVFGISDLHVLLYLVKENMSEHKLFKKCLEAQKMANSMNVTGLSPPHCIEDIARNGYLKVLTTIVAWGTEDPSDKKTKEVLAAQRN